MSSRLVRSFSVFLRPLPHFLIVGTQKGGTTSLYEYLTQHPQIVDANNKEVHFFDDKAKFDRGVGWYRTNFRNFLLQRLKRRNFGRLITGEASPTYMFNPMARQRMAQVVPNAKLIMILRDPVRRAYSHYQMTCRRKPDGTPDEKFSFEEAIALEEERIASERSKVLANQNCEGKLLKRFSYVSRGLYANQLEELLKYYPREQILVLHSEAMFANPQQTCDQVFKFLDIAPFVLSNVEAQNVGHYDKSRESPTHQQLREFFAPHNQRLYNLIGQDFGW